MGAFVPGSTGLIWMFWAFLHGQYLCHSELEQILFWADFLKWEHYCEYFHTKGCFGKTLEDEYFSQSYNPTNSNGYFVNYFKSSPSFIESER